jgi:hypothetical membrane protein
MVSPEGATPRQLGAAVWMFAIQFFIAQVIVQSAWTTSFSLTHNFISDLGNTTCGPYPPDSASYVCSPWHLVMNASFVALGLTIILGTGLIRGAFPPGWTTTVGLGLVALAGPGFILVGLFPENGNIMVHKVGAALNFVSGNLGLVVVGAAALLPPRGRTPLGAFTMAAGVVGLVSTWLFVSNWYLGMGAGGMERFAAYPLPLWLTVVGMHFFARSLKIRLSKNGGGRI